MSAPNRTMCNVLDEIRKCFETYNFSPVLGLVEEAQSLANRMEAALWDQHDYTYARKRYKKLNKKLEKLEKKVDE